jgi:hypothetical protein
MMLGGLAAPVADADCYACAAEVGASDCVSLTLFPDDSSLKALYLSVMKQSRNLSR